MREPMSASHAPFADPVDVPRTWRRWWQARPRWLKIAVWAGVGAIALQAAIAVRIWFGLMETPEMARLRSVGGTVVFTSIGPSLLNPLPQWDFLVDGFWGRSNQDVTFIVLQETGTDELVAWICDEFPNVQVLMISESPITSTGISHIPRLSQLQYLNLRSTNVDDRAAGFLSQLPNLRTLEVQETLFTDAAIPALMKNPSLIRLEVGGTEVGREAYIDWLNSRNDPRLVTSIAPSEENLSLSGSIRWADGAMSAVFNGRVEIFASCRGANRVIVEKDRFEFCFSRSLGQKLFEELANGVDGDYRFVLTLNGQASAPVDFQVTDGRPSIRRMEFVMPINEATARSLSP